MENKSSDFLFDFAIDRGGTFTDIYCEIFSQSSKAKIDSTIMKILSEDPSYPDAPREAIRRIITQYTKETHPQNKKLPAKSIRSIRMGTTVATNALLERKGNKTGLLITKGFRDLMVIGTQNRQKIFDLEMKKPEKLFSTVLEIEERVRFLKSDEDLSKIQNKIMKGISGDSFEVIQEINQKEVEEQLINLKNSGVDSLAIVLMFSYALPDHELKIEALAKKVGFSFVSVSHKVVPMIKIVPRGFTTILDAYLNPHSIFIYYFFTEQI